MLNATWKSGARAALGALCTVGLVSLTAAQVETPTDSRGRIFDPYQFQIGAVPGKACEDALNDQGYSPSRTSTTSVGTGAPPVTIAGYIAALGVGWGVFQVTTHGNSGGHAVEVYEYSPAGLLARDMAYNNYVNNLGIPVDHLYISNVEGYGYHIGITAAAIATHFEDQKSIVYNISCRGAGYENAWGAREVINYTYCALIVTGVAEALDFWNRMNGQLGPQFRTVGAAQAGNLSQLGGAGGGQTVLSPIVMDTGPDCVGDSLGFVEFDANMNVNVPPNLIVSANNVVLANHVWATPRLLTFDVTWPPAANSAFFQVAALGALSGNNARLLDGNDCNTGPTGKGPSGDDHCWFTDMPAVAYCTAKVNSCGTTPAISFSGTPSATASFGFTVTGSNARGGGRYGSLIYTNVGPAALPFDGGTLCVQAPFARTPTVTSGGTPGQCDGSFSLDMNAFAAGFGGGDPNPFLGVPGTTVWCQWIGRDTVAHGRYMTDGLHYCIAP